MSTTHPTAPQVPASPSSHTRALWPADPAPQHWPAPRFDARSLASLTASDAARKAAREEVDLRTVRRMVGELVAMACEGVAK